MSSTSREIELQQAHGTLHVLSVGVSAYHRSSEFSKLKVCTHDAIAIRDTVTDVRQLNVERKNIRELVSGLDPDKLPTRGTIVRELMKMAERASHEDRLLFYFSGHGVRIDQEFYFVPEDVAAISAPSTLLSFTEVTKILNESDAKQKLIVVDACYSGPDVGFAKSPLSEFSPKALAEYIAHSKGAAWLASSGSDETSTTQSPDPKFSLFTYFVNRAFRGEKQALRDGLLTVDSLNEYVSVEVYRRSKEYGKKQRPAYETSGNGTLVLGDFRRSLLADVASHIGEAPIDMLDFIEHERVNAKDVLKNFTVSSRDRQSYIEKRVNQELVPQFRENLGRFRSAICRDLNLAYSNVTVDDGAIDFPGGRYTISYEADSVKTGHYVYSASFGKEWFDRPLEIIQVLKAVDFRPDRITLYLKKPIQPESFIPGLQSHGWEIDSALPDKVVAARDGLNVEVSAETIHLEGFTPQQILGTQKDENARLAVGIFGILAS
jgi:Caspase domain